jgi:dsRNA-specific ribonuclease
MRGIGQGKSKKEAETVAAREALSCLTQVDSPGLKR